MSGKIAAISLALMLATGCGSTAFSPSFRDNNLQDVKAAMAGVSTRGLAGPENATGRAMVFLVANAPKRIVAYDLEQGKKVWEVSDEVTSKVVVGRDLIFHRSGKRNLVARRVSSGQQVWSKPITRGDRLLGVATDGTNVYYVVEYLKRTEAGVAAHLVSLRGRDGNKRWVQDSQGRLGAPAAMPGRVFLPLRYQSLAVINAENGAEIARVRSKDEMLLWVRCTPAGVLFGGKSGIYRLDEKAIAGTQQGSSFFAADLPSSVRPVYWWDGYNAALSGYTAYDRNRLLWQLDPDQMDLVGDKVYVHNYRFFFAFGTEHDPSQASAAQPAGEAKEGAKKADETGAKEPDQGGEQKPAAGENKAEGEGEQKGEPAEKKNPPLRWVYTFPRHDVVASVHTGEALLLISDNGVIVGLDLKTGAPVMRRELQLEVSGATFDARGFAPEGKAQEKPELRKALTEVIWDPDRRFGAVKLFAVEQLARLPGEHVSEDLVEIVTYPGIDPAVYKLAGQMIVDRHDRDALPLYLKTLRARFNFVEDTQAKAVDIMARAVADLKAKEAVPLLVAHLEDHETPLPTVEAIVKALIEIGDEAVLVPFRDFLLMYRADPDFKKSTTALNLVADGLLKLGGEEERQLLRFVQNDSLTLKPLRTYLAEAMKTSK